MHIEFVEGLIHPDSGRVKSVQPVSGANKCVGLSGTKVHCYF